MAINDSGRVYGNAYDSSRNHVAVYDRGVVTVLNNTNASYMNAVNENGTVAGAVYSGDPTTALLKQPCSVAIRPN
ncbi:MAG: hypothetical protein ABL933_02985 [Methyloglobulus sp.]|nr:hypothetical protein [Methyloglobulus sp.]